MSRVRGRRKRGAQNGAGKSLYQGERLQKAAELVVMWSGGKRPASAWLGVSHQTVLNWLSGGSARATGMAAKRLALLVGHVEGCIRQCRGLASAYATMIYDGAPDRLRNAVPRDVAMQRVSALEVKSREPARGEMVLSMMDFRHNRERFACIVCASMFPELTKREVWALVKDTVFGGSRPASPPNVKESFVPLRVRQVRADA